MGYGGIGSDSDAAFLWLQNECLWLRSGMVTAVELKAIIINICLGGERHA